MTQGILMRIRSQAAESAWYYKAVSIWYTSSAKRLLPGFSVFPESSNVSAK
jgi:hypothetical protein